jgi:hypothetical protein
MFVSSFKRRYIFPYHIIVGVSFGIIERTRRKRRRFPFGANDPKGIFILKIIDTIIMIKNTLSLIVLLSLSASVSCANPLALNPNSPASFLDLAGVPHVASYQPANGSIDVPISTSIMVIFTSDIDIASVSLSSFVVADSLYIPIDGIYSFPDTRTAVFTPSLLLSNSTKYNVLLTRDITDIAGNGLGAEKIWYFTTISAFTIQDPVFTPVCGTYEGPQVVSITCPDTGAIIRFTTDGSDPTPGNGSVYTAPLHINVNTPFPVKAMAYRPGFTGSSISSASYTIQAFTPAIDPPAGTYSSDPVVTLSSGAAIKYTLDLSDPETNPAALDYTGPFPVPGPGPVTVRAVALSPDLLLLANSPVLSADYIINYGQVAPPVFSPDPGTYPTEPTVTFSSPTSGSHIKYTAVAGIDGSDPHAFGIEGGHGVSLKIRETTTITTYAYDPAAFLGDSSVMTVTYIIAPVIYSMTPNKGPNYQPISVTVTGAHFRSGVDVRLKRNTETDIVATSVVLTGDSTITCTLKITGCTKGKWSLVVTNTDAGTTEKNEFRIY